VQSRAEVDCRLVEVAHAKVPVACAKDLVACAKDLVGRPIEPVASSY
jgi:hypothetical protein